VSDEVRAFIALELPPSLKEGVACLVERLRPLVPGARFVKVDGLHLTLRFLGDSPPARLEKLEAPLAAAAAACPVSSARVDGLGTFPERGHPRVLWLGLDLPAPVLELQRACERAAVRAGFPREDRPFRPHLTLARFRERVPRPAFPDVALEPCRLETLTLFRSDLRPDGAVHTALLTRSLGGPV